MKLYRFTASTTQSAMMKIKETFGPNALIYSTRKLGNGVEILAGLPLGAEEADFSGIDTVTVNNNHPAKAEVNIQETLFDHKMLENLQSQVETMNESIQHLSTTINALQQAFIEKFKKRKINVLIPVRKFIFTKLAKLGAYDLKISRE